MNGVPVCEPHLARILLMLGGGQPSCVCPTQPLSSVGCGQHCRVKRFLARLLTDGAEGWSSRHPAWSPTRDAEVLGA